MLTLNPLRTAIAGVCLIAGMASAQATLTITFEQDDNTGYLNIYFSGQQSVPSAQSFQSPNFQRFDDTHVVVIDTNRRFFTLSGWTSSALPWTNGYTSVVSVSGTGGFISGGNNPQFVTASSTSPTTTIIWDATSTYVGNLEGIGLSDGSSGTIIFTNNNDTFSVDWSAYVVAVPEPATYALVLGIGVAGIALLRRRASR